MAVDKLVDSTQLDADLTSVANAIRTKGGTTGQLAFPVGFVSAIEAISGGGPVRLIDQATVTMASTATSSKQLTVQLTSATNCAILVVIDEMPEVPSDGYTALAWYQFYSSKGSGDAGSAILRAAGTIGTDNGLCTFTKSTGKLRIGGPYGQFRTGLTYHIYEFEVGAGA